MMVVDGVMVVVGVMVSVEVGVTVGLAVGDPVGVIVAVLVTLAVMLGVVVGVWLGVAVGASAEPSQPPAHVSAMSNVVLLHPAATQNVAQSSEVDMPSTQNAVPAQLLHAQHMASAGRGSTAPMSRALPRNNPTVAATRRRTPLFRLARSSISVSSPSARGRDDPDG